MAAGEAFSRRRQDEIRGALRRAEHMSGLAFSLYVGPLGDDPRAGAVKLHAALTGGSRVVLVAVDPAARRLEIVTGAAARRRLDDRSCALAGLSMTTAFAAGDLFGGITTGLAMLADHARRPQVLHTETG